MKFLPRAVALLVAALVIVGVGVVPEGMRNYFQRDLLAHTDTVTGIDNPRAVVVLNPAPSRLPTELPQHNAAISGVEVVIAPSYNPQDNVSVLPPIPSAPIVPTQTPIPLPTPTVIHADPTSLAKIPAFNAYDLYIHLPPENTRKGASAVIIVLHGMGGNGETFARPLVQTADQNGWVLVAPTIPYRDYMNTKTLWEDDIQYTQMLHSTIETLQTRLGIQVQPRVTLFGFSRGAQLAHRFALFFPDHVRNVITISAGAYTLPVVRAGSNDNGPELKLPFGIADFENTFHYPLNYPEIRKLAFYVAVGADDNKPGEVPREFDQYVGKDRVERAKIFADKLKNLGVETKLAVFPNTGHEVTPDMRRDSIIFIRDHIPPQP